jgi:hypothetical protein
MRRLLLDSYLASCVKSKALLSKLKRDIFSGRECGIFVFAQTFCPGFFYHNRS